MGTKSRIPTRGERVGHGKWPPELHLQMARIQCETALARPRLPSDGVAGLTSGYVPLSGLRRPVRLHRT